MSAVVGLAASLRLGTPVFWEVLLLLQSVGHAVSIPYFILRFGMFRNKPPLRLKKKLK